MQMQTQSGPVATTSSIAPGTIIPARAGNLGDLIVSECHGRYYEQTYRRNIFNAANQAAATTTVGLALAYTGLLLYNPVGSTVNLSILKVGYSFVVAFPAAAAVGLMVGFNSSTNVTHTVAGVTHNSFFGVGASSQAGVDTSSTMPTAPFLTHLFATGLTGAITTEELVSGDVVDLEGSLILPPGAYAAIYTSTVSGTSGFFGSFSWEEVPV